MAKTSGNLRGGNSAQRIENSVRAGVESSTFKKVGDNLYRDENGFEFKTTKIGSNLYAKVSVNNLEIPLTPRNTGITSISDAKKEFSGFFKKYNLSSLKSGNDFNALSDGLQREIRDEAAKVARRLAK